MTDIADPRRAGQDAAAGVRERPLTPAEERKAKFDREADEQIERFEQRWDYQRY